jgi:hypothetical protein
MPQATQYVRLPIWPYWKPSQLAPPVVTADTFDDVIPFPGGLEVLGFCSATNNSTSWSIVNDPTGLLHISNNAQLVANDPGNVAIAGTYTVLVEARNAGGSGQGSIILNWTTSLAAQRPRRRQPSF